MKRAICLRLALQILPALIISLPITQPAQAAGPKFCKRAEQRAQGLLDTYKAADRNLGTLKRAREALVRSIRKKELKLQASAVAQARSLEKVGEKFADSLKSSWIEGDFRQRAIGLTIALPDLPPAGGRDVVTPAMLAAPFTLNLEGPAAAKDVYDVFLKNYFDFKYPYGDPKDPLEIERKAALVTRMTEDTIEKLQKLRAEARSLLETRLKSSLCRPLEDGGDDCGGVSSSKAKRLRSALTRDQQRADHALLMFEKHVSNVLYRPCKGSILKYEKGLCSDEFDVEIKVTEGKGKSLISPFSEAVGRFRIEAGKPYIIEARGTYDCGDGVYVADAGNVSSGGGPFEDAPNSHPDKPRYCELTVNGGFIDWGPFKPDNIGHVYSTTLIAPAAQLDFQLYDESLDFNNNSGSLQVKVCQALTAAS